MQNAVNSKSTKHIIRIINKLSQRRTYFVFDFMVAKLNDTIWYIRTSLHEEFFFITINYNIL